MERGDETGLISFRRLHYGKLAEGPEGRVPPDAGYAVTRRAGDLDAQTESLLSPLRLTGLRRFEPDVIDIDARGAGCLVIRTFGDKSVLMRARFRPEDGEQGFGRLHQQSAIWVADFADFAGMPAACLALAARDLHAVPDRASESAVARLSEAPLSWRAARPAPDSVQRILERAPWAVPMLETLLDGADHGGDAMRDFGRHDFATEGAFLSAVGFVLEALPSAFPRWRDICIVSGLSSALPGLCLRYLPSWGRARAAA
jgi:hypothetical protein